MTGPGFIVLARAAGLGRRAWPALLLMFSSGCIRVEDPLALTELVLDTPAWNREALESGIAAGTTRRIDLARHMPVLLVYLTATTTDPDGVTRFFSDVYGRDAALIRALNGPVRLVLPKTGTSATDRKGETT